MEAGPKLGYQKRDQTIVIFIPNGCISRICGICMKTNNPENCDMHVKGHLENVPKKAKGFSFSFKQSAYVFAFVIRAQACKSVNVPTYLLGRCFCFD